MKKKMKLSEVLTELPINDSDSKVTKKAKENYNNMSEQEFLNKSSCHKSTYAKRVIKYDDPYMNSPLAKFGKFLSRLERVKSK